MSWRPITIIPLLELAACTTRRNLSQSLNFKTSSDQRFLNSIKLANRRILRLESCEI